MPPGYTKDQDHLGVMLLPWSDLSLMNKYDETPDSTTNLPTHITLTPNEIEAVINRIKGPKL